MVWCNEAVAVPWSDDRDWYRTVLHKIHLQWRADDIPEATLNQISANYLSTLVLQTAGLPLTQYNRYLASLYQKLPIINTVGYVDADNNYYTHSENSKYDDLLYQYHCLVYNSLIDRNNRDSSVFFMNQ